MARPTERTFNEFNLIEQFKKEKIKTLINLQCVNEHDFCGPQLITHTGFSYDPEILMSKQIYYYNFGIPDFGTISVHSILNIAKVIWFSLKKVESSYASLSGPMYKICRSTRFLV